MNDIQQCILYSAMHERDCMFNCSLSSIVRWLFSLLFCFRLQYAIRHNSAEKCKPTRNCDNEKRETQSEHIYLSNVQRTPVSRTHRLAEYTVGLELGEEKVFNVHWHSVLSVLLVTALVPCRYVWTANDNTLQICWEWICLFLRHVAHRCNNMILIAATMTMAKLSDK